MLYKEWDLKKNRGTKHKNALKSLKNALKIQK